MCFCESKDREAWGKGARQRVSKGSFVHSGEAAAAAAVIQATDRPEPGAAAVLGANVARAVRVQVVVPSGGPQHLVLLRGFADRVRHLRSPRQKNKGFNKRPQLSGTRYGRVRLSYEHAAAKLSQR